MPEAQGLASQEVLCREPPQLSGSELVQSEQHPSMAQHRSPPVRCTVYHTARTTLVARLVFKELKPSQRWSSSQTLGSMYTAFLVACVVESLWSCVLHGVQCRVENCGTSCTWRYGSGMSMERVVRNPCMGSRSVDLMEIWLDCNMLVSSTFYRFLVALVGHT